MVLMGIKQLTYDLDSCEVNLSLSARRWSPGGISVGAPISTPRPAAGMRFSLLSLSWVDDGGAPPPR